MANESSFKTLGGIIRDQRIAKEVKLRELARQLEIAPSYLSDIEHDRRVPAEPILRRIANILGLEFDQLLTRTGRVGEQAESYIKRRPTANALFRMVSASELSEQQLRDLMKRVQELRARTKKDEDSR